MGSNVRDSTAMEHWSLNLVANATAAAAQSVLLPGAGKMIAMCAAGIQRRADFPGRDAFEPESVVPGEHFPYQENDELYEVRHPSGWTEERELMPDAPPGCWWYETRSVFPVAVFQIPPPEFCTAAQNIYSRDVRPERTGLRS